MSHSPFLASVQTCVSTIEPRTAATLAVVLRGSSGSYRDIACLFGAAVAWIGLTVVVLVPEFTVHEWSIPFDVLVLFALGAWLCSATRLRRWLTTRRRRRRQVRTAAQATFVDEGLIHATDDSGVLVFWSQLEREVVVVADTGVLMRVPPAEWNAAVHALRRAPYLRHAGKAFLERLEALGELLAKHVPLELSGTVPVLRKGGQP
jgi:uncharacterized membrane protein